MAFTKEQARQLLQKAKDEKRLGHAYLIAGSIHAGVEVLSEELAAIILECGVLHLHAHPDFHLIEPESKSRKILTDQIRVLEESVHLKPHMSDYKVAVIHDADRMMPAAANAFLKTLEEPPDKTLLILTTTLPEVLLETIRSRCIALPLYSTEKQPLEDHEEKMSQLMDHFLKKELSLDATAAFQLARSFQALLTEAREAAVESADEEFDHEKKHYGKTTDGPWESRREEHFKAAAEAEVLRQRSSLIDIVADYFGEQLRSEYIRPAEETRSDEKIISLLRALEAVESLRASLERGVQETLALEAGFLRIMAAIAAV